MWLKTKNAHKIKGGEGDGEVLDMDRQENLKLSKVKGYLEGA